MNAAVMKQTEKLGLNVNSDWAKLPLFDRSKWQRVRFGDVVENVNDTERDPVGAGIERFIAMEHLEPGSLHIRSWGNVADGTTFNRRCRVGQVLFGKRRAYQRKVAVAEFDSVVSGDIYVFAPKGKRLLLELLPFICISERFVNYAVETSAGSLSPRTNWSSLAGFEFDIPPMQQQRRIADLLWELDTVHNASESLLGSIARARSALTASLSNSTAFEKWPSMALVDCLDIVSGQVDPKDERYRSMTLIAPNHIEQATGRILSTETATQQNAISGKYIFKSGDVIYSKIRPNLRKCVIAPFDGLCSADMYALRPKHGLINARYLELVSK